MKRFYCTICKRVKRVRNLPSTIEAAIKPVDRTGVCHLHGTWTRANTVQASDRMNRKVTK